MIYTHEVQNMCPVAKGAKHEPAPIPEEGNDDLKNDEISKKREK